MSESKSPRQLAALRQKLFFSIDFSDAISNCLIVSDTVCRRSALIC